MSLQPMSGRVILKAVTKEATSAGGIILAGKKLIQPEGEVVAVNQNDTDDLVKANRDSEILNVGDHVFYDPNTATPVQVGDVNYLIVKYINITARVPK